MKIYLVGGAVRNRFLNLPIKDRDWMIVGATPKQLLDQGFIQVGQGFPVFLHPKTKEEYALARTERKSGSGYKGFICDFNPLITLEEDLIRRDLTINAIAQDEQGQIHDPFNGQQDLKNKCLRHISPAFREDPLRVLRVARFAAEFHDLGFTIAPETLTLMTEITLSNELQALTAERIWIETEKALKTPHPKIYFLTLKNCKALNVLFPELSNLFNENIYNFNLGEITFNALEKSAKLTQDLPLRFAALTQLLCFNQSTSLAFTSFLTRLKVPNHYKQKAIRYHLQSCSFFSLSSLTSSVILELLYAINVWKQPENLHEYILILCVFTQMKEKDWVNKRIDQLIIAFEATKNIDAQLMIQKGFIGKHISQQLYMARLEKLKPLFD